MGITISDLGSDSSPQIIKYTRYRETIETKRKKSKDYLTNTFYNKDIKTQEESHRMRRVSDPGPGHYAPEHPVGVRKCRMFPGVYQIKGTDMFIER